MNNPKLLEIRQGVLGKNDQLAAKLRARFRREGTYAVNLVSGPGSGKTALLEATLRLLRAQGYQPAALVGDLATENDAARLARSGAPVRQIVTAGTCHLEADMIASHLEGWLATPPDFLFIENVGNLVCPASFDLGENLRVALLSVTEGEDKPQKYPPLFNSADAVILTKMDLAAAVEFDMAAARASLRAVAPGVPILESSARSGAGLEEWLAFLIARREADGQ
ncbi:MAG: hydrogenase nickel incorporation protein HypB [Anaerolineales bacterium]|nr:hydrogenase nickel incorporation protein HypB [Anaerolineales bacterium]